MIWNFNLVSFLIINSIPCSISVTGKRKKPMDTPSDIMSKRLEYENNHRSMFTTTAEYEIWPELTTDVQKTICEKYIQKLFKRNIKLVVSSRTLLIQFQYKEKLNEIDHSVYKTPVAAIKCEISPPSDGRKFIFFTRSPNDKCLYLMNISAPASEEFYVVEEICEYGEYNFWEIFPSRKYENNCKYRKLMKVITIDPTKQKEYESSHFKDYLLHKDQYVRWSEFGAKDAEAVCRALLSKLLPGSIISLVYAGCRMANIQYTTNKVIENVTVSALKCYLPEKGVPCYQFIKAPGHNCAYLIKQRTLNHRIVFNIIRLISENDESPVGNKVKQDIDDRKDIDFPSDIVRKRILHEKRHRSMYSTEAEHDSWAGLTNDVQFYLCTKYINKLFKRTQRTVVATLNTSVGITYVETKNKYGQYCEQVTVAALRCEISPPADGRKFIYFIKSFKNECLYLIKPWGVSNNFRIVEEISEFGDYSYWNIIQSKTSVHRQKYSHVQKWKMNDADKQEEYETNHLKDYILHKDKYVKWHEVKESDTEELCKMLLSMIIPKTIFSILNVSNEEVVIHYIKIQKIEIEVSDVAVGALKCHIPEKRRDNCFRFIKAPIENCVHFIKHINSRSSIPLFYISKIFCVDDNEFQSDEDNVHLENDEKQDELASKFHEIKSEPHYEDNMKTEYNDYEQKDLSISSKKIYSFI